MRISTIAYFFIGYNLDAHNLRTLHSHHTRTRVRVHTHTKKRLGDVAASCVRGQTRSVHVV
jgi:hypothetical protein